MKGQLMLLKAQRCVFCIILDNTHFDQRVKRILGADCRLFKFSSLTQVFIINYYRIRREEPPNKVKKCS